MKFHPTPLAMALAAALGSLIAVPATAALVTTTPNVAFSNSAAATDPEGGAATTNNNAALGTSAIQQFDASSGVLMGTTLNLTSTRTQTTTVTALGQGSSKSKETTSGTGSSTAQLSAAGASVSFGSISANASCEGTKQAGCTGTNSSAATATTTAAPVAAANLDSYVGLGTLLATRTAPLLSATQTAAQFPGAESTKSSVTWAGNLTATYDYLLHADASFDGVDQLVLNLNFGSFTEGSGVQQLGFSIYNAAGDRVGLDFDSFGVDSGPFSTNLAAFLGLAAGGNNDFLAYFDTSTIGEFSHSYTLYLSDADVGAASSRYSYTMTLNLIGEVTERAVNGVPEPSVLALAGLGLLGLALTRRRQRPG